MKSKDLQLKLLYPEKLSFRMEGQIKCFLDQKKKKNLKDFIITKTVLESMLHVCLQKEEEKIKI